jgi:hypothetical protein
VDPPLDAEMRDLDAVVREAEGRIPRMKSSYLFVAILVTSGVGVFAGNRGAKTALSIASAAIALYGLIRIIG